MRVDDAGLRRSTFLKGAATALVAPGLLARRAWAAGPSEARDDAWPQAAHDLEATRAARRTPRGLEVLWRRPLAGGLTGPPLVVERLVLAASLGGEVAAFDLADGRERWRRTFPPATYGSGDQAVALGFFGGCAAEGGRLVVASDRMRCLRLRDGAVIWEAEPLAADGDDYFWGAPVIACGLVLAGSGAGSEASATRGRVTAYSLRHGGLRWSAPLVPLGGNGGGVLSPVSVDLARRAVFAGTGAPYLPLPGSNPGTCSVVELSLDDGRPRWADQLHPGDTLGFDVNSAPVIGGAGTIAATAKDGVWAWDRRTRTRLWRRTLTPATPADGGPAGPVNGPEGGPLAADAHSYYALSNDGDAGHAVAARLDARTGRIRWRRDLGGLSFAAPALAGRLLCATTASGDLEVLDAGTGREVGRVALGGPSAAAVASARGRLLLGVGAEPFLPGGEVICVG